MPKKTTTTTKKPTIKDKVDEKKEEKIVEEVIVEEEEVTVEEPKEEVDVEKEDNPVSVVEEAIQSKKSMKKDVRIKVARNHKCFIGGEWYDLKEGNIYNVPEFVKQTLANRGLLLPL